MSHRCILLGNILKLRELRHKILRSVDTYSTSVKEVEMSEGMTDGLRRVQECSDGFPSICENVPSTREVYQTANSL